MTDNNGTPQSVTIEYLQQQRAAGWPDVHPEDYCHKCGNRNISWWVDSGVWNAVMDSATSPYHGILCPSCFGERFEERHPDTGWELRLSEDTRGARTFRTENPVQAAALTPTNDEREVLDQIVRDHDGWWPETRDAILALYVRRTEVPEPSAETVHRGTFGHVWPCPLFYVGNWKRGDEEYYPVKECSNPAVCEAEPQAEPSSQAPEPSTEEAMSHYTDPADPFWQSHPEPQAEPSDAQAVAESALALWNNGRGHHDSAWVERMAYNMADALRAVAKTGGER